jgi:predicted DNA-binding transcriptional regulator
MPYTLKILNFHNNPKIDYYIKHNNNIHIYDYIVELQKQIRIVNQFRELFYALKYKKQLHHWLWVHVREPKIRNKYHPSNLMAMLEEKEDMTLDELDELLEKW